MGSSPHACRFCFTDEHDLWSQSFTLSLNLFIHHAIASTTSIVLLPFEPSNHIILSLALSCLIASLVTLTQGEVWQEKIHNSSLSTKPRHLPPLIGADHNPLTSLILFPFPYATLYHCQHICRASPSSVLLWTFPSSQGGRSKCHDDK